MSNEKYPKKSSNLEFHSTGCDLNVKEHYGGTALWFAAHKGNYEVAEMLCKAKANVDIYNNKAATPFHGEQLYNRCSECYIYIRIKPIHLAPEFSFLFLLVVHFVRLY